MYKVTKPIAPEHEEARAESQERHTRLQELLAETLTLREASERYDVSTDALTTALKSAKEWQPRPNAPRRFLIRDIEAVAERLQLQREAHTSHGEMRRPLWFLDEGR